MKGMEIELEGKLDKLLEKVGCILRLRPTYVRRFYTDGGRLGLGKKPGDTFDQKSNLWVSERWIASTVTATNPHPIKGEGLSFLAVRGEDIALKQALNLRGERLLGAERNQKHESDFLVLIKILDGNEPIVFHFHAKDEDVWRYRNYFSAHRFGKDEAYYFLNKPKGPIPYTHVGLYPGVTREELVEAVQKGPDYALQLSPVFYQRFEEGFYLPAGIVHRPGTALTLEIQQPSDHYTLLETHSGGLRMPPEQIHPGFKDLQSAFRFIDMERCQDPDILERNRLIPTPVEETHQRGLGQEDWIFPPSVSKKFSGKRLRVQPGKAFESVEVNPYAILVWKGRGKIGGQACKVGDEFFVGYEAAVRPHLFENTGTETLEVFKLFPAEVE